MANYIVCLCLLRILLPICIISSVIIRPVGFSLLYLLLMFYLPFVPVPTTKTFKGHTGHYLRIVLIVSIITLLCQLTWHVTLASIPKSWFDVWSAICKPIESSLRHIGLVNYYELDAIMVCKWISPEVLMFMSSTIIYIIISKLCKGLPEDEMQSSSPKRKGTFLVNFGKYLSLFMLMIAGCLRPSILSGIYYLTFLGGATWWACGKELSRGFAIICKCIMALLFIHVIMLFVYQSQWILELLPPENQISRLLGFTQLISMNCTTDPRNFEYLSLEWASFLSPVVLLLTYYLLAYETSELLNTEPEKKLESFSKLECGNLNGSIKRQMSMRLSRKRMMRNTLTQDKWRSATRKVRLIRAVSPKRKIFSRKSNASSVYYQDSTGSVIVGQEEGIAMNSLSDNEESENQTLLEPIIDAISNIFNLLRRSSYVATAIIMMAWSITYHSWLTFVLLLWANVIWMVENQRGFTLRSSPVLVAYAQILLLAQYIYGMNITEEELPSRIQSMNMKQIGFERPDALPCLPLLAKSMYTVMFWVTLRQFIQDKKERRKSTTAAELAPPTEVTVGEGTPATEETNTQPAPILKNVGDHIKGFFTKYWICVVAVMLFAIGITGKRMTVFRIVYMALFLIFILTFQISIRAWRKMMYVFWVTVIVYSMSILILVYTYQFDDFPEYWDKYLHIPVPLQLDIGLERYQTKDLFLRLITPTSFLIVTVIQLHYFHKDFLAVSHMKSRSSSVARQDSQGPLSIASSMMGGSSLPPSTPHDSQVPENIEIAPPEPIQRQASITYTAPTSSINFSAWLAQIRGKVFAFLSMMIDFFFLFLELHLVKIILLSIMLLCVFDICALHFGFVLIICISLMFKTKVQLVVIQFVSGVSCILLLLKMIYQIEYIVHDSYAVNCTYQNSTESINGSNIADITYNNAEWLGFKKTNDNLSLPKLLKGYIGLIMVITFKAMVDLRQSFKRYLSNDMKVRPQLMFPKITRLDADKDLKHFFQFLFNFGFYKFGVEISLMCLVGLIGSRMDSWAVLYGIWLCVLWNSPRERMMKLWIWFMVFIVCCIPIQYLTIVGMLPQLCISYPWMGGDEILQRTRDWFMLPDPTHPPFAAKIMCDFILLIFCSRQSLVFRVERRYGNTYKGGSNSDIIPDDWESPNYLNPVPDFVTYIRSWLDIVKRITMLGSLWVTLAIMFLTGTNRVNLFSLGYLIGSFVFLWQGTNLYLRPIKSTLRWWNWLLGYNVAVIFIKSFLQIVGCIFIRYMQVNACWIVQLLGIGCIDKFSGGSLKTFFKMLRPADDQECSVPREDIGLAWDGVCFGFLLMQRRLFHSNYFLRIIEESKAITVLQSRGAELIEELRQKQMKTQEEQEKKILQKIKVKMDRIKANQQKLQGPAYKEPTNHFVEDVSELKSSILMKRNGSNISECCVSIQTPAGGYHTPRTPTTPGSPRGYHTPISEEGSPVHQQSPPGPPSPFSALMTVSLDAYLEPQRISFGSPPSSELNPRAPSPSESYPVFSPPPPRRRRCSSQSVPQWALPAPAQLHTPRHSVISFSSRSQLSHHTYPMRSTINPILLKKHRPRTNKTAIRSGDYYMFEEFDDDDELDLIMEKDSDEEEIDEKPTLGQLLSTAMKTDIGQATRMRRGSVPPVPIRRNRFSTRSLRQSLLNDTDIHPVTQVDGIQTGDKKDDDDDSDHPLDSIKSGSEVPDDETLWNKICKYVAFGWAFIESFLISLTKWLNKFSRDYRYVAKVLTKEKIVLKEREDFGVGIRAGIRQIWEPLPSTLMKLKKPQNAEATADNCEQQNVEIGPRPMSKDRRKESMLSVPAIRILAPSMERGLDLDSPHLPPTFRPIRQSSVYSIPSSSESTTQMEEYDDETFAADQPTIFRFCFALWYAILAHTDIVCYFMIFINQIQSATILSLPLPLMVFLWGTLTIPRPSKTFWVTIIAYTEVIVLIKCMSQYEILPWNQNVIPQNMPFSAPRIIGVERKANYALYDLILLLLVFFHRFMLISLGLWKSVSPTETIEEGIYPMSSKQIGQLKSIQGLKIGQLFMKKQAEKSNTIPEKISEENLAEDKKDDDENKTPMSEESHQNYATPKASQSSRDMELNEDNSVESSQTKSTEKNMTVISQKIEPDENQLDRTGSDLGSRASLESMSLIKVSLIEDKYKFPEVVKMSTLRYYKPVKDFYTRMIDPPFRVRADVYAYMFMCDFFNFMVVIFGFSAFGTQQGDGGVQAYLEDNKVPIPFLVMLILQFGLIVIDRALFLRKFIVGKILFQICLIIGVHIWMFFILPAVTERSFNAKLPPPMWYMVKCIYLLFSAYQIRCGYPTRILGNFLCKGYNYVNMFLFKGFMIIPFLFELRALMDWIWTNTSMTLMDWLKMEDIFANVFQLKCSRHVESEYPQPRGEKKKPFVKYLVGGSVLAIIIAIIWFPLVLFAFGNSVGEPNSPYDVTVKIRMGPYLPIYTMSAQSNNIKIFSEDQWNELSSTYKKDRTAQTFLSNYVYNDLAAIILNGNSTNTWGISPPDIERLQQDAISNHTIKMKFTYIISHKTNNKDNPPIIEEEIDVKFEALINGKRNPQRDLLVEMLEGKNVTEWIVLENMFPKFVKVFNKGTAKPVNQLMDKDMMSVADDSMCRNISLKLTHGDPNFGKVMWWEVREQCGDYNYMTYLRHIPYANCNQLVMYTFNDKLFPATLNFISGSGIIGLYTTFVFVASRILRGFFADICFKIMFEDLPNVDRVLQLCLDIYLVRESGELALEEDLFAKLVFLYRSPETMIKWTRPKEEEEPDDEDQQN